MSKKTIATTPHAQTHAADTPGVSAATLAKDTWRSLRSQLRAVPASCWYRWTGGLALGFAACSLLMLGITRACQAWEALPGLDRSGLVWLVESLPMAFADAIMYESPGNLLYLGPLTLLVAVWAIRRGRALVAVSLVGGYLLQRPLVLLGWYWWERARPELVAGGIASPGFHSFPSGHTALSTFVYGFLAYLWIRSATSRWERVAALLLAAAWVTLISAGRLRLGAHWPSDMIAGCLIALAWLAIVIGLHRYLESCTTQAPSAGSGASGERGRNRGSRSG